MNISKPMTARRYENCLDEIDWAFQKEYELSQKKVALGVRWKQTEIEEADLFDCTIFIDGSWQTRGYSSMNGVVTCMAASNASTMQCLQRTARTVHIGKTMTPKLQNLLTGRRATFVPQTILALRHPCGICQCRSSIHRSFQSFNLRYTKYLGDGDSSSFANVQEAKPYGDQFCITKLDCIGHIQKRIGSRLRQLKIDLRGKKLLRRWKRHWRKRQTDWCCRK